MKKFRTRLYFNCYLNVLFKGIDYKYLIDSPYSLVIVQISESNFSYTCNEKLYAIPIRCYIIEVLS